MQERTKEIQTERQKERKKEKKKTKCRVTHTKNETELNAS